jgi:hypothetical protein
VTVKDRVETPQLPESGYLTTNANNTDWTGDNVNDGDLDGVNGTVDGEHDVEFVASVTPGAITLDDGDPWYPSGATPGRPVEFSGQLRTGDLDPNTAGDQSEVLANQTVTLKVDKGFFVETDGDDLAHDPAPAAGADAGEFKSAGTTITVTTDEYGDFWAVAAIERDADFDDDGEATSTVTANVGTVTDSVEQDWSSSNPLNGGAVTIDFADDSLQDSGVLPKSPLSDEVALQVGATDQFGNPVGNEEVTVSGGNFDSNPNVVTGFNPDSGIVWVYSNAAADTKYTATWVADTRKFESPLNGDNTVSDEETLKDDITVNWYAVDFANSTFTLSHTGADTQPVGTTVTETYTAMDQFGEPISDLGVVFYRTGPDDLQDGDGNQGGVLGQDGKISYVFQGAKAGKATITAVGYDDFDNFEDLGTVVPEAQRTDEVQFQNAGKSPINLKAGGKNNGKKADKLKVTANDNASGLVAKVFVNGKKVASHALNASGDFTFTIADKNKGKGTKYVVKVAESALTQADQASKTLK